MKNSGDKCMKEDKKLQNMRIFEFTAQTMGYSAVCGIDEAGRGPLAGKVYAGAVILPHDCHITGIDDSKKLNPEKREKLYDVIKKEAVSYGIGTADVSEIESLNIRNAAFLAMKRALEMLTPHPDYIFVDGDSVLDTDIPYLQIIKGDAKSVSVAAASILAKVARDRYMNEMAQKYPGYGFDKHKGYGTAEHIAAIKKYGLCEIHRKSFLKNILGDEYR